VSREDIARGAEMLELPLEELIEQVIAALRAAADQLGVRGQTAA
jgi:predicted hydrolase (HD superfamily)